MHILLAEDEQDMSRVLAAIFKHEGYDIDVAANGQEAVDLAKERSYDCMIMDVMMPVKDGLTALAEIRASGDATSNYAYRQDGSGRPYQRSGYRS